MASTAIMVRCCALLVLMCCLCSCCLFGIVAPRRFARADVLSLVAPGRSPYWTEPVSRVKINQLRKSLEPKENNCGGRSSGVYCNDGEVSCFARADVLSSSRLGGARTGRSPYRESKEISYGGKCSADACRGDGSIRATAHACFPARGWELFASRERMVPTSLSAMLHCALPAPLGPRRLRILAVVFLAGYHGFAPRVFFFVGAKISCRACWAEPASLSAFVLIHHSLD